MKKTVRLDNFFFLNNKNYSGQIHISNGVSLTSNFIDKNDKNEPKKMDD